MALPLTGFPLATWGATPITFNERVATHRLGLLDVHFGRNWSPEHVIPFLYREHVNNEYGNYGPRAFDINHRGGTVAEKPWEEWKKNPQALQDSGFVTFFNDFNNTPPAHKKYGPGSVVGQNIPLEGVHKYSQTDHHGQIEVTADNKGKEIGYVDIPVLSQFGMRWSKTALEWTRQKMHGMVHFHLEGLGDIQAIIGREPDLAFGYNITARELRYLQRNWQNFRLLTCFYNGYDAEYKAIQVNCPW